MEVNMHDQSREDEVGMLVMFATITVCCVVGLWWLMSRSVLGRGPPGPRGLPLIGNLHQLGKLPHQTLARLSQIHGPLMSLRLGSVPFLVVSSPHAAKLVLHTHDKVFAGRPLCMSAPMCIYGPGSSPNNILFRQPDPYWKLMRQICVTDFFSNKRLEHFRPVRLSEVRGLLLAILPAQGSPLSIRSMLHTATSNTVSTMALGKPLHEFISADPSALNLTSVLLDIKTALGEFDLGDYIPGLAWLDVQGFRKSQREVARNASSVLQTVIDTRRLQVINEATGPPRDLLDLLLMAATDAKNKDLHVEDANIRAVLLDMFIAGTDTTAVPVEWALAELLANPEKLRKLQQELEEVVGPLRTVEESDLQSLPYLQAVINEVMRLHPPGPLLVPHRALEACELEGYRIPANTLVYVNVWAIHRDPTVWENPSEFRPERFLEREGLILGDALIPGSHQFQLLPFGSGRRSCPAWKLAILSVQTLVANLIHAFHWSVPTGKPSLAERFGIAVTMEEPLVAIPSPRLHPSALA